MTASDDNNAGLFNLGENGDEGIITSKKLFLEYFFYHIKGEKLSPRNIIYSIYFAYSMAHGLDIGNYKFMLLHPHSKHFAFSLNSIFPEMLHLIPIRDPMRAYCSERKLRRERDTSRSRAYSPRGLLSNIAGNLYPYYKRKLSYTLLRIEDFGGANQVEFLSLLAKRLDISFSESLMHSTFMGKSYWGSNPSHRTTMFDIKRHTKPLDLKRYEIVIFSTINWRYLDAVGYSQYKLAYLERIFGLLYLFLPLQDEINWFVDAYINNLYNCFYIILQIYI